MSTSGPIPPPDEATDWGDGSLGSQHNDNGSEAMYIGIGGLILLIILLIILF